MYFFVKISKKVQSADKSLNLTEGREKPSQTPKFFSFPQTPNLFPWLKAFRLLFFKELFEKSSLRNLKNFYHSRGSDDFPQENGGVSRQDRVAACRRQAHLSEKGGRKLFRYFNKIKYLLYFPRSGNINSAQPILSCAQRNLNSSVARS